MKPHAFENRGDNYTICRVCGEGDLGHPKPPTQEELLAEARRRGHIDGLRKGEMYARATRVIPSEGDQDRPENVGHNNACLEIADAIKAERHRLTRRRKKPQ